MLDSLDLDVSLVRKDYKKAIRALRDDLRDLQQTLRRARVPVVVVLEGWAGAGKGDTLAHLVYPLDPRGFDVVSIGAPREDERRRPPLARYFDRLPERGDFTFYDGSWYRRMLDERVAKVTGEADMPACASEIRGFERQLVLDGHVLVKLWLHISRKEQQKRLAEGEGDRYDKWRRLRPADGKRPAYKAYLAAAEEMLEHTSTGDAPWTLIEATDARFRRVKAFETLVAALRGAVAGAPKPPARRKRKADEALLRKAARIEVAATPGPLDRADLTRSLDRDSYEKKLDRRQEKLRDLHEEAYKRHVPLVIVYEGWDAGGKGGNIKRLTQELDPRGYEVVPIGAPDETEKAHHYLWRFWRRLPRSGHMAIFDRSWYGRVLVERVEGLASEDEWRRAYREINDFERQLHEFGTVIVKFWLEISPEEQLRRFREREKVPHKQHKLTPDDWRNRLKWNEYRDAVNKMIERTSSTAAPWTVLEAENKLWARIRALDVVTKALAARLKK